MKRSRSCIIHPHHAGLFSILNKVITCAELYEDWWVNWRDGTLYSKPGEDLWEHLFDPARGYRAYLNATNLGDKPDEITDYPHQRYTYKEAEGVYKDRELRRKLNGIWQTLGVRPELIREAFDFVIDHFNNRPVIGALVRAHTHRGEQISDRSQELQEYADAIMAWYGRQSIEPKLSSENLQQNLNGGAVVYLMAGDSETVAWFKDRIARCDVVCHPATKRLPTRDIDRHLSEPQTMEDARQVMVETMILSLCRAIVHPISNIATAALYMNPAAESIFIP